MMTIGEIAHSTGVSRRMLRHWEQVGLLEPASVDGSTGYRRYAPSQVGRVRAVASLRALGFSLCAIGDLLDARVTEQHLVELLQAREHELVDQVTAATARLVEVRARLSSLQNGAHTIMTTLELGPLPPLRLHAVQATVLDETEIPDAAARLLTALRHRLGTHGTGDVEVVLLYDGTDDDSIVVTAGATLGSEVTGLVVVDVAPVPVGASVTFEEPVGDVGDAWIALDAQLEDRGLRTTGVYRQVTAPHHTVTLQAAVRPLR